MLVRDHNGVPLHSLTNLSISAGDLRDYQSLHASGLLRELDITGCPADIWYNGGVYTFSTEAVTHYISSSNDSDTVEMKVFGLDENWEEQTQLITLVGQAKTAIPGTWIRINGLKNPDDTAFQGNVYVYENDDVTVGVPDTASKIRAIAEPGLQIYRGTIFTVPAGKTGYITKAISNVGPKTGTTLNNKATELGIYIRNFGSVFRTLALRVASLYENTLMHEFPVPYKVEEKTDIKVTCTECFVNDTKIFAAIYYILEDN